MEGNFYRTVWKKSMVTMNYLRKVCKIVRLKCHVEPIHDVCFVSSSAKKQRLIDFAKPEQQACSFY